MIYVIVGVGLGVYLANTCGHSHANSERKNTNNVGLSNLSQTDGQIVALIANSNASITMLQKRVEILTALIGRPEEEQIKTLERLGSQLRNNSGSTPIAKTPPASFVEETSTEEGKEDLIAEQLATRLKNSLFPGGVMAEERKIRQIIDSFGQLRLPENMRKKIWEHLDQRVKALIRPLA